MKDKINFYLIILAGVSLVIGLLGKIIGSNIIFANATWHMFAQTCLLGSIAFGLHKNSTQ